MREGLSAESSKKLIMDLGKYHIFEEIGHGGFGTVYRANDTTLDRIVALKVLHPQYLSDQKFIESFKREARMMARVSHPNVVQLFEVGDLKGQIYIAMQYFDAGNLDQRIQSGGPLPLKDAIRMLSQTARGLEAGHKIGLVHRDVKPANILFNREGYIAISDFGVAKSIQQSSPETTNSYNQFAGTPYYIPPELWKSEGNPSPAADVYSLACVFYEALTGEVLFAGDTYEHVLTRHVLEAPVFSKAFPECLVDTLNVALAKNPSDRYQTMNDFLAAVRGALEKQARKPARTETTQEQTSGIEELPKPLAPGEITFADLVRRSQQKTTQQRPVAKPAPISQPTPPPVRPAIPVAQPQIQKSEPKTEPKPEPPVVVPIIRPPRVEEQPAEPIAEVQPPSETLDTEPKVGLPEPVVESDVASEPKAELVDDGLSEDESIEDFFARTSAEPLKTEQLELQKAEETPPQAEQPEDDLILEDWLAEESTVVVPEHSQAPVPDGVEDAPLTMQEGISTEEKVADEVAAETTQIPLVEEIVSKNIDETPVEQEETIPVEESDTEEIESAAKETQDPAVVEEIAEEVVDEYPAEAEELADDEGIVSTEIEVTSEEVEETAVVSAMISEVAGDTLAEAEQVRPEEQDLINAADEAHLEAEQHPSAPEPVDLPALQPEEQLEAGQAARSVGSTEDRFTQSLKERQDLLAHNGATSRFDQSIDKTAEKKTKKKPLLLLLLAFGGIAVIALAFLVLSGQAESLFGGKPSSTPTFTLTLLPSNTAAAPVNLLPQKSTSTALPSSTSTDAQISTVVTLQTPTRTAAATATLYPTAQPTDRPTNPPVATTAPPVVTIAPPTATQVPPTIAPPTATQVPPTIAPPTATNPPADTPVPTRGPTPTPP